MEKSKETVSRRAERILNT
nr:MULTISPECIES: hypothetical protein [unclassified Rickettsia]